MVERLSAEFHAQIKLHPQNAHVIVVLYVLEATIVDDILNRALDRRQQLSKQNVQKLFSRKMVEQGFLECFELIGGVPRLALWANDPENYGDFLKLLVKFAPKEVSQATGQVLQYHSNVPQSPLNRVIEHEGDRQYDDRRDQYDDSND